MMLSITASFAGFLALMLIVMTLIVGVTRVRSDIWLMDGGNNALQKRMRAHGNFVEYVPLALILMALAELAGAPAPLLIGVGCVFVAGRMLHAATLMTNPQGIGRAVGMVMTMAGLLVPAGWLAFHALSWV